MTARERLGLIGMGAAAAIASAAAVYLWDRPASEDAAFAVTVAEPAEPVQSTKRSARLQDTLPPAEESNEPSTAQIDLRASLGSEQSAGENPDTWSAHTAATETPPAAAAPEAGWHTDVTAPRAAPLQPENLPWQASAGHDAGHASPAPATERTLQERLAEISPAAKQRIKEKFDAVNAAWPPAEITLIALKDKKVVQLYARPKGGTWQHIHKYPVLAASGTPGPKLRQGDKQVPEGIYNISFLNPNSRYHVSMRLNYPNDFDRQMAAKDGRTELGGDIMIHGKAVSIGCLAMGDEAAEELFVLAAETGLPNVKVIIAPTDFRGDEVPHTAEPGQPQWLPKLYTQVASAMTEFPKPAGSGLLSFFGN